MKSRWPYSSTCLICGQPVGEKRAKGMCQKCYRKKYKADHVEQAREGQRRYYRRNPKKFCERIKQRRYQRRMEMIETLGGKCACCGETEKMFLCLDHIKGNGRRDYEKKGGPHGVWRRAIAEGLPRDKYRILCWNCNSALGLYGFCPHSNLTSPRYIPSSKNSL